MFCILTTTKRDILIWKFRNGCKECTWHFGNFWRKQILLYWNCASCDRGLSIDVFLSADSTALVKQARQSFEKPTTSPLTLNITCQSSSQLTTVHCPSVHSPSNYLIPILLFIFLLLCTPVSLLAHSSSAHLSLQCLIAKLF